MPRSPFRRSRDTLRLHMAESAKENTRSPRTLRPSAKVEKQLRGITRTDFHSLLKKISKPSPK
jgi:hypothetical protein